MTVTQKREAYEIKFPPKTDGKPIKMITKQCRTFYIWMINNKIKKTLWLQTWSTGRDDVVSRETTKCRTKK